MDEEKKTYTFKFVVEDLTRQEAEEVYDIFERAESIVTTEDGTSHYVNFIGMNENDEEEDPDEQEEAPKRLQLSPGLFGKSQE